MTEETLYDRLGKKEGIRAVVDDFYEFVVVLPTVGTALILFVVVAYLFERVSKLGLLASPIVFSILC